MKYDRNGRMIESRTPTLEAKGLTGYQYRYDLNGNCTEVMGPDGRLLTQYTYTPGGLVTEELDGAGEGSRYGYDLSGRRIQAVTTGGSSQEWSPCGKATAIPMKDL